MMKNRALVLWLAAAVLLCMMIPGPAVRAQALLPQDDYETPEAPIWGPVYGDANGDGEVTGKDLILLRQKLAGWDVTVNATNADVDGDGTLTGKDLILLRQVLAGWDVEMGPAPEGDEHSIVGDWVTVTRYDDEYRNTAEVLATFMSFYEDGTGEYSKGAWGNHDDSGNPSDSWEPQPMGYPTFSFTYTLDGDQLSVTIYYEDDVTVWRTEEHTVSWNEDGSIILTDACYRLMPKSQMTVEELLTLFGLDPNVPQPEESHSILGTWVYVTREDMDEIAFVDIYTMEFRADGTGFSGYEGWANCSIKDGDWTPVDYWIDNTLPYNGGSSFTYTLEGDQLTVTYNPITDVGIEAETYTYTLVWHEDGSLEIKNGRDYRLMPEEDMTVEELLVFFGLDPKP